MTLGIILCKPVSKKPLSEMIMDAENTDFSHIAISLAGFVYHARWPKFKVESWSSFISHYQTVRVYSFGVPESKESELLDYLESLVGKKYSVMQLLLIGLGLLSRSIEKRVSKVKLNGHKRLICSEAAAGLMIKFFGCKFNESVDTIGLRDVQSMLEVLEENSEHGNIWLP